MSKKCLNVPSWDSHVTFGLYHARYDASIGSMDRGVTNEPETVVARFHYTTYELGQSESCSSCSDFDFHIEDCWGWREDIVAV